MKFSFSNIGLIKEAEINVNGLSVIGGYNDTGKSFIGKTLFLIFKSLLSYTDRYGQYKSVKAKESVMSFLQMIDFEYDENDLLEFVENILDSVDEKEEIYRRMQKKAEKIIAEVSLLYSDDLGYDSDDIKSIEESLISELKKLWRNVLDLYLSKDESKLEYTCNQLVKSIFHNEITSFDNPESISQITEESLRLNIKIAKNECRLFRSDLSKIPFTDITLIDSPAVLNLASLMQDILLFESEFSKVEYSHQLNDLLKKIVISKRQPSVDKNSSSIINQIEKIISGKVYYDRSISDFIYLKSNTKKIRINNTASGVKTFGLIQLLISSGIIGKNKLLILDEPEVHLHPEWQLQFAEIICLLVKNGVSIVVSTHSPYMIEALEHYSGKYELKNKTNFHVGVNYEGLTTFRDVSSNLEDIYHQLALPMQKLSFD